MLRSIWIMGCLVVAVACATAPNHGENRAGLSSMNAIRDKYLELARQNGLELSFVPELREWTRPSVMSWRQEARPVAVPRWSDLNDDQRHLLKMMAVDDARLQQTRRGP